MARSGPPGLRSPERRPANRQSRRPRRRRERPPNRRGRSGNYAEDRMDDYEWYDEDEPYVRREPYFIVERREPGVGTFLVGLALGAGVALLLAPQSGEETRRGIARRARRAQEAAQGFVEDV